MAALDAAAAVSLAQTWTNVAGGRKSTGKTEWRNGKVYRTRVETTRPRSGAPPASRLGAST